MVRAVLNGREVRRLLKSPEVTAELLRRGERIAAAAGPGFVAKPSMGPNRARVAVVATTAAAQRAEARDGALSMSVDAGRG